MTIQDQILALLLELQERSGMTLVLVSHDLAVVAETCDRIAVMYAGRIVETGADDGALRRAHATPIPPVLLNSIPHSATGASRLKPIPGQPPDLARSCRRAVPLRPAALSPRRIAAPQPVRLREAGQDHLTACLHPERIGEARGMIGADRKGAG